MRIAKTLTKRRRATDPHPTRTSRPGVHTRPDPYTHHTGRWERRHQVTRREDLASDPKYTDERHGFFNRWQKRAGFGDGGGVCRGVSGVSGGTR